MSAITDIPENRLRAHREKVLVEMIAQLLPERGTVLAIGSGDGKIAAGVNRLKPVLGVEGVDVAGRLGAAIPTREFDGLHLDFPDGAFDWCVLVDRIHCSDEPEVLLQEAARVCRKGLVIKDFLRDGTLARPTLRFMDKVGRTQHARRLPCCYWSPAEWVKNISAANLTVEVWCGRLYLYPWWSDWAIGRGLHVLSRLTKAKSGNVRG
jgi:SAM-dependent methyltransferase